MSRIIVLLLCSCLGAVRAGADDVLVAVAANFAAPMQSISQSFERETGHRVILSPGSTGGLYAQISNGAPYELFLAADSETPRRLEADGRTLPGSRFVYAVGKLALWSSRKDFVDSKGAVLKVGTFEHLAIADPKVAPYGTAAMQVIANLGLRSVLEPKLVTGGNISQTFQFVSSGNAELGFVALSQVQREGQVPEGSLWLVPPGLYEPIQQEVVALKGAEGHVAAIAVLNYLRGAKAQAIVRSFGYGF